MPDVPYRIARSEELWPDPFAAPDVPPREMLLRYLNAPATLDPDRDIAADLAAQIAESANCRRALDQLHRETHIDSEAAINVTWRNAPKEEVEHFLGRLHAVTPESAPKRGTATPPAHTNEIAPGQLWSVELEAEHFDGHRMGWRRRWRSTDALVVEAPRDAGDDVFVRAVAASPALLWPVSWMTDNDVLVTVPGGGEYVAHLWLEYPMSVDQCASCLGVLADEDYESVLLARAARIEGLPVDEEVHSGLPLTLPYDAWLVHEMRRLCEIAGWLCATHDARRSASEDEKKGELMADTSYLKFSDLQADLKENNPMFAHMGEVKEPSAVCTKAFSLAGAHPSLADLQLMVRLQRTGNQYQCRFWIERSGGALPSFPVALTWLRCDGETIKATDTLIFRNPDPLNRVLENVQPDELWRFQLTNT